jgi:hypothetical protein
VTSSWNRPDANASSSSTQADTTSAGGRPRIRVTNSSSRAEPNSSPVSAAHASIKPSV